MRDHGGDGPAAVLIPSLINPPRILDLDEQVSLAGAVTRMGRRTLLLTHADGLQLSPSLASAYRNQRPHDPLDIDRAREIASLEEPIPVGILYRNPDAHWDLYQLGEELTDLEDAFRLWRFRHVTTVERVIGFKRGTGGTSGVGYLRKMLDVVLFPEIWRLRTDANEPPEPMPGGRTCLAGATTVKARLSLLTASAPSPRPGVRPSAAGDLRSGCPGTPPAVAVASLS